MRVCKTELAEIFGVSTRTVTEWQAQGLPLHSGGGGIPAKKYPGQTLREFGLMSEAGTLIAYGAYPDTWLPAQEDTIVKEITVKFVMPLVHAECVTLEIDPNIAVITQEEGDKRYLRQALRLQEIADQGEEAQSEAREHLDVFSRPECDERFQPKGNYTPAGEAYTKTESDERFLNAAENLADAPDKAEARKNLDIYSKGEGDERYQPKGNYTPQGEAYTKTESNARYLQDVQYGAERSQGTHDSLATSKAPAGHVLNGIKSNYNDGNWEVDTIYFKPTQKYINGAWVTISG